MDEPTTEEFERLRAEVDRLRRERDAAAKDANDLRTQSDQLFQAKLELFSRQLEKQIRAEFLESAKRVLWVVAILVGVATADGALTLSDQDGC
jgi:archaellum component FlaC